MKSLEQQKSESPCYGMAFSSSAKECKICHFREDCKLKSEAFLQKPESPMTKSTLLAKEKAKTNPDIASKVKVIGNKNKATGMPDFKALSLEDLEKLAAERCPNDTSWQKFDNVGIRRMRVTMAIKKTYE